MRDSIDPEEERARWGNLGAATPEPEPIKVRIKAAPFVWREPSLIPRRAWLYARHYIRQFISVTVAPGGVGKSSLVLVEAIAMVTGRNLLGVHVEGQLRVWYVNLEDPIEEIERRITAILLHYEIEPSELDGRLFINSGDECPIVVMTETQTGARVVEPVVDAVKAEMEANQIDVLMLDPFASTHAVSENDNGKINAVKGVFASIARAANASVELVHHVRKGAAGQGAYTVDDGRGAKALVDGARVARVLNGMTQDEAAKAAVDNNRTYFRVDVGKANLSAGTDRSDWFHLVSVSLGNSELPSGPNPLPVDNSDHVGVVTAWEWPEALADVTVDHLRQVQVVVDAGRYRESSQAKDWVGFAVAQVLGLDPTNKAHKAKILGMLKVWMATKMLVTVEGEDAKRNKRTFVEVGEWASD